MSSRKGVAASSLDAPAISKLISWFGEGFWELIFPIRCLECGCLANRSVCNTCGQTVNKEMIAIGSGYIASIDDGVVGALIRKAKFKPSTRNVQELLEAIERPWSQISYMASNCSLITWVPPDHVRRIKRGGNIAELLARALARESGIPATALFRRRVGRAQKSRRADDRRALIAGQFRLSGWGRKLLDESKSGKFNLVVVDDIRTTGATMEALRSLVLRENPDAEVTSVAVTGVPLRGRTQKV